MDIAEIKEEIARLKTLTAEKEGLLFTAEQNAIAADNASVALVLRATTHSLICPFCGVTVMPPYLLGALHVGCYSTGCWVRGFKTENDWVRACITNGLGVAEFYRNDEKNLNSKEEHGERPDKT
jgi:hypothetical protein